jgi:hypothetical protein
MLQLTKGLARAILHGEYMKACTDMERIGVPLDIDTLRFLQDNWDPIRLRLAGDSLAEYNIFDGLKFSHQKFEMFLEAEGLEKAWPRTDKSKSRQLNKETWEGMVTLTPELEYLWQLYKTVTMPQLNIACDMDGRNRVLLGAFGTTTSRNNPRGDAERGTFIFAPAKWVRFLIKAPKDMALAYLDWSNQEFGIGAILSGDKNMLRSYEAGDPYMELAIQCGAAPAGATKKTHRPIRDLYKGATLGIGYGQTEWGFSKKTKVGAATARQVFAGYKQRYSKYIAWRENQIDDYDIGSKISTRLGWTLHRGDRVKPNTVLNFGAQANAAEMLRLAIIEMCRRGVDVCCPVHDAVLIQAPITEIESAATEAQLCMNDASAAILAGFILRVDRDIYRFPERFHDEKGEATWRTISEIVEELKQEPEGRALGEATCQFNARSGRA